MRPERRPGGRDSGRRVSIPVRLPAQESWRESDKSREREGGALAVNKAFFLTMRERFSFASSAGRT